MCHQKLNCLRAGPSAKRWLYHDEIKGTSAHMQAGKHTFSFQLQAEWCGLKLLRCGLQRAFTLLLSWVCRHTPAVVWFSNRGVVSALAVQCCFCLCKKSTSMAINTGLQMSGLFLLCVFKALKHKGFFKRIKVVLL